MSHWQTGKLDLKCSINILKKALVNVMPEWEDHIVVDESGELKATFHGSPVEQTYHITIGGKGIAVPSLYGNIGLARNESGTWEIGGDNSQVQPLRTKLTGEVARMKALAIAQMRGYDVLKNENGEDEIITEIRVDADKARELL